MCYALSKRDEKNDSRNTIQQHHKCYPAARVSIALPLYKKRVDANDVYFFSNVDFCSTFGRHCHDKALCNTIQNNAPQ